MKDAPGQTGTGAAMATTNAVKKSGQSPSRVKSMGIIFDLFQSVAYRFKIARRRLWEGENRAVVRIGGRGAECLAKASSWRM